MIKPEELRVGNLFNWSPESSVGVGQGTVYVSNLAYFSLMNPITLTSEWLEKAGFEYAEGFADDYTKHPITLYSNPFKQGWTVENLFNQQITEDILVIQYVHQLQNIFFALTGKELEFSK